MALKVGTDQFHKYLCGLDYYQDLEESQKVDTNYNIELDNFHK